MKTFLLIILLVGGVIAGVVMLMFLPDIMNFFRGILGSFGGIMCIMLLFKKKSYIDREMEKHKNNEESQKVHWKVVISTTTTKILDFGSGLRGNSH